MSAPAPLTALTLTDGGQTAEAIAERLVAWLGGARRSLDLALYDVRLPGAVGDAVADALRAAAGRGVRVRIAFNAEDGPQRAPGLRPLPPPPRTEPSLLDALGVPLRPIPGEPDLMHHKFVVRDGAAVWTGSTNWTLDSWTREENVVRHGGVARSRAPPTRASSASSGTAGASRGRAASTRCPSRSAQRTTVRPWFCPGRGAELSAQVARRIAAARRRVRIASPVLTAGPVLATLNEVLSERRVDVTGVVDATQVAQVFGQWAPTPSAWKGPLLARALDGLRFTGKPSTPYAPGSVHDYMHAKVVVCDDLVLTGSYNVSRSGEQNAENVLEVQDAALADELAAFIDARPRAVPAVAVPPRWPPPERLGGPPPLALGARAHEPQDLVGVVGDRDEVEVAGADQAARPAGARGPSRAGRPRTPMPTSTTGKWRILPVWMSTSASKSSSSVPNPPGNDDEGRARSART